MTLINELDGQTTNEIVPQLMEEGEFSSLENQENT
jgi:hypothetical protein